MFIDIQPNYNLHWWGNTLFLVHNSERYYALTEEEVFLVKKIADNPNYENVIVDVSNQLGLDQAVVKNFVDTFIQNYSESFFLTESRKGEGFKISGGENAFYPLHLHVSLTNTCIQKCKHCYKSAEKTGEFIVTEDLFAFLDKMEGYVPFLSLSGGDPVLHPKFHELVRHCADSYNICVHTSGYLCNEELIETFRKCKAGIMVSIYSSNPDIHDAFTETEGSYKRIFKTLTAVVKEHIPVGVTTLLTRSNYDDIKLLIEQLNIQGVNNISIGKISPVGRAKDVLKEKDCEVKDFDRAVASLLGTSETTVSTQGIDFGKSRFPHTPFKCAAGSLYWSIYENGEIQPCGAGSFPELCMGRISSFDGTILFDRSKYLSQISDFSLIKSMASGDITCPFSSSCH